jgi:hypothetical protein
VAFGLVAATLDVTEFTLAWTHSVEKIRWEEDYRVTDEGLIALAARVQGSGAGMEPPADAVLRDGWWHYQPQLPVLSKLTLARSSYVPGYEFCARGACRTMSSMIGAPRDGETIDLFPCRASLAPPVN